MKPFCLNSITSELHHKTPQTQYFAPFNYVCINFISLIISGVNQVCGGVGVGGGGRRERSISNLKHSALTHKWDDVLNEMKYEFDKRLNESDLKYRKPHPATPRYWGSGSNV